MNYMLEMMKNMVKNNQGNIIRVIPGIVTFGFNILTGKFEGGFIDVDGSIDHYDRYQYHTLREAPPGSRRKDMIGFGPNAGKKFKIRK